MVWGTSWGFGKGKPAAREESAEAEPQEPRRKPTIAPPSSAPSLDETPLSHRIGLALDAACRSSGIKQWRWLQQMAIPPRAFHGWKTGSIAPSLKSLDRLLPMLGWTLTITDAEGQVIVTTESATTPGSPAE